MKLFGIRVWPRYAQCTLKSTHGVACSVFWKIKDVGMKGGGNMSGEMAIGCESCLKPLTWIWFSCWEMSTGRWMTNVNPCWELLILSFLSFCLFFAFSWWRFISPSHSYPLFRCLISLFLRTTDYRATVRLQITREAIVWSRSKRLTPMWCV